MPEDARDDVSLWLFWKRTGEMVRSNVVAEVTAGSGLSEPELTVLVQVNEAGGRLRQNSLAAATGWDRGRLSHLLTRMESRGYVSRERLRNGVEIVMLAPGQDVITAAQPHLAAAVDRHLTGKLTPAQREALREILTHLC
jgi:DNA-binding MarR family transcriptional regulator